MMIARWQFTAKFGHKQEAVGLIKQWNAEIGAQTKLDMSKARIVTASVGASEGLVETEFPIQELDDLQDFFDKIATVKMHQEWGPKMGSVIVSGSTRWDVFRVL